MKIIKKRTTRGEVGPPIPPATPNQPPNGLQTLSLYRGKTRGETIERWVNDVYVRHTFLLHIYSTSFSAFDHVGRRREPNQV